MDTLMAFFLIGWLGATGLMGLAWYWFSVRTIRRTDDCRWCGQFCPYCWPDSAPTPHVAEQQVEENDDNDDEQQSLHAEQHDRG